MWVKKPKNKVGRGSNLEPRQGNQYCSIPYPPGLDAHIKSALSDDFVYERLNLVRKRINEIIAAVVILVMAFVSYKTMLHTHCPQTKAAIKKDLEASLFHLIFPLGCSHSVA